MTIATLNTWKVRANDAATAWLNASIASSQEPTRSAMYRTLSVEFFPNGVQFIGCDGHMLFRTWAPLSDIGDLPAEMPGADESPDDSVVVMDGDKFAVTFMRTLLAACTDEAAFAELTMSIEPVLDETEPPLGEEVTKYVLTLHAFGQQLSCKLFEDSYPDWRGLEYGLNPLERVDGMILGTKLFAAVGKLKGVIGIDCEFRGEDRAITFTGTNLGAPIAGLLMPMKRVTEKKKAESQDDEQTEIES